MSDGLDPGADARKLPALDMTTAGVILAKDWGEVITVAQYLSKAGPMIPAHLRDNPAMCMGVVMDASAWGLNPFRLATQHMVVNGVGSYMSQAITAAINAKAPIRGRLVPEYSGTGDDLQCRLNPISEGGQELPYESPKIKEITTKNSPLWKQDVRQQLFYFSARAWARRYFPELLMGAYDIDEARSMKDVSPKGEVQNFLNDEGEAPVPVSGEVIPPAAKAEPSMNKEAETVAEVDPMEIAQAAADGFLKEIAAIADVDAFETWRADKLSEIVKLPPKQRGDVQQALNARWNDLDEL